MNKIWCNLDIGRFVADHVSVYNSESWDEAIFELNIVENRFCEYKG